MDALNQQSDPKLLLKNMDASEVLKGKLEGLSSQLFRSQYVQQHASEKSQFAFQGRHGEFEPDKAHSTVVGIICPPG